MFIKLSDHNEGIGFTVTQSQPRVPFLGYRKLAITEVDLDSVSQLQQDPGQDLC